MQHACASLLDFLISESPWWNIIFAFQNSGLSLIWSNNGQVFIIMRCGGICQIPNNFFKSTSVISMILTNLEKKIRITLYYQLLFFLFIPIKYSFITNLFLLCMSLPWIPGLTNGCWMRLRFHAVLLIKFMINEGNLSCKQITTKQTVLILAEDFF